MQRQQLHGGETVSGFIQERGWLYSCCSWRNTNWPDFWCVKGQHEGQEECGERRGALLKNEVEIVETFQLGNRVFSQGSLLEIFLQTFEFSPKSGVATGRGSQKLTRC